MSVRLVREREGGWLVVLGAESLPLEHTICCGGGGGRGDSESELQLWASTGVGFPVSLEAIKYDGW